MKKSIFLFFAAILCAMSINAANMTGGEVLYLKPNSNWTQASAWFAMYLCNGSSSAEWVKMEKVGDYYQATVPAGKNHKNVIFCRMNPASQTLDWSNKWNQSGDLSFDQMKNLCTIKSGQWDCGSNVTWSTYQPVSNASLATSAASLFVGAQATLTPSLSSNANVNTIKSTSYSVSPATGSVTNNKFTATAAGEYTVTATVTYYPNGCTSLTSGLKTATATATITVEEPAEATHDVTISYMCAGTSIKTADQAAAVGEETASLVEAPEISNYTFSSWTLGSGVTSTDDLSASSINIKTLSTGDYTLTANYEKFKLTYTVTVPEGTENCYLVGEMNEWDVDNPIEMANQGNNIFKVVLEDVTTDMQYKYISKKGSWDYSEVGDNRTWTANDVVTAWKDPLATDVYLAGSMTDWANSKLTFKKATIDATTATVSVELAASTEYYFKVIRGSDWTSSKDNRDIKASVSGLVFSKDISDNTKLTTAAAGNYIFTWDINQSQLSIAYPEVTPEYKDITIQVYAKQVPNIWWWNGGDNCPSTEDIVNPSTGNKYQWNEAPAMEKVAGEDNWYTKTFAQVDITKGGIKFKLQSTDHNTSTTNEVVTTEDKCYDARVIATVTETTCGELPSGEIPTVTYNVTVPAETPACYIAGAMNGWSHQAMTKVDETHYTITIEGAEKTQEYKYSASNNWDCVELNEDGSEKSNRTWTENDVVAKWAKPAVITYALMGVGSDWTTGITMTYDEENNQYVLTNQSISKATDAVKVAKLSDGSPVEWYNTVDSYSCAHEMVYDGFDSENIVLEDGTYDFYFKLSNNEIYIEKDPVTIDVTLSGMVKNPVSRMGSYKFLSLEDEDGNQISIMNGSEEAYGDFEVDAYLVEYDVTVAGNGTWAVVDGVETLTATLQVEDDNTTIYNVVATVGGATTITLECWDATYTITDPEYNEVTFTGVANGKEFSIFVSYFGGEYYSEGEWGETFIMGTEIEFDDSDPESYYLGGTYIDDASNTYEVAIFGAPAVVEPTPDYTRGELTAGKFGTLCLPFGSTNYTGMELYECVGSETGKVYLGSVTTLVAGVPYIFKATGTELAVYSDGTTAAAGSHNGLHGTFTDDTEVAAGNYILKDNALCQAATTCYVNANRAYLVMGEVPEGAPVQMPGRRYIGMSTNGENEATGFENITAPEGQAIKAIVNGQLIIIRDGEMYNAMGVRF